MISRILNVSAAADTTGPFNALAAAFSPMTQDDSSSSLVALGAMGTDGPTPDNRGLQTWENNKVNRYSHDS